MCQFKIEEKAIAVLIGVARDYIGFASREKQGLSEDVGVGLGKAEGSGEDPGLMATTRMMRVEAVVAELCLIDYRIAAIRELHEQMGE